MVRALLLHVLIVAYLKLDLKYGVPVTDLSKYIRNGFVQDSSSSRLEFGAAAHNVPP